MTFSSKEALASRWYIMLACTLQLVSLITVGVCLGRLTSMIHVQDELECCASITWWGTINACEGPSTTFWIYYALRIITAAQSACVALRLTQPFDQLKKSRPGPPGCRESGRGPFNFEDIRATANTDPILLVVSLEVYLDAIDPVDNVPFMQYGQSIAYFVCVGGLLHWAFLLGWTCYQLWKSQLRGPDALLPLDKLRVQAQSKTLTPPSHSDIEMGRLGTDGGSDLQTAEPSRTTVDAYSGWVSRHATESSNRRGSPDETEPLLGHAEDNFAQRSAVSWGKKYGDCTLRYSRPSDTGCEPIKIAIIDAGIDDDDTFSLTNPGDLARLKEVRSWIHQPGVLPRRLSTRCAANVDEVSQNVSLLMRLTHHINASLFVALACRRRVRLTEAEAKLDQDRFAEVNCTLKVSQTRRLTRYRQCDML
jgi:hypothetical protein